MIYLDNSATTRPCGAAALSVRQSLEEGWFNPSAPYGEAVRQEKRLGEDRRAVAALLVIEADALTFTASGTEADSLALLGAAERFRGPGRILLFQGEHPAVLETAPQLARLGHKVELLPAADDGVLDLDALDKALSGDVRLVSCMHVNNETGAVQPIAEIAARVKAKCPDALFHVDGVQGFLRVPLQPFRVGVDLYAVSAHKVHGMKGVGALAVRKGVRLFPRVAGGGQEKGQRSGTENTAGIAAFAAACGWVAAQQDLPERLRAMKLCLYEALKSEIPGLRVNGPGPETAAAAPHILNLSFPGVRGEVMLHALEAKGVLVGTGSACSSKKRGPSPAFAAMRAPAWAQESAIRISLSAMNMVDEMEEAASAVLDCYQSLKAFQRR